MGSSGAIKARGHEMHPASLPVQILKDEGVFVAHCPALWLAAHGRSPDAAMVALKEQIAIFLEEIKRMGTLTEVLLECGWTREKLPGSRGMGLVPPRIATKNIEVPAFIPVSA